MNEDAVRVTDAEREQAVARLREATVDGRLTLEEFSGRMGDALAARTRGDLVPVTADLALAPSAATPSGGVRRATRWMVALMGSSKQRGRWRVDERSNAVAIMGDCEVDLRSAALAGAEIEITAVAVMGAIKVIVPPGVAVELDGIAIMGDRDSNVTSAPQPGAPSIRVRAFVLMGEVKVEEKASASGTSDASSPHQLRHAAHGIAVRRGPHEEV